MTEQRKDEEKRREMLRRICDKDTCEAIDMLGVVNRPKSEAVTDRVLEHFDRTRRPVAYGEYRRLIEGISSEPSVLVRRREDGLSEMVDIEDSDC